MAETKLRLLNSKKPQRHGVINSDVIVGRYLDRLKQMPQKYGIDVAKPVPLVRRVWRWVLTQIGR